MKLNKYSISLLGIILLGVVLRFFRAYDLITFENDTGRDMIMVYKLINYREWIFHGPEFSVIWGFLSPVYYYILALVAMIGRFNPASFGIFTLILNSIALILIAFVSYKIFGKKAAIISTILYSTSFTVILEAGKGFNTCFIPVLSVLFLYSAHQLFFKKDASFFVIIAVLLAFMLSFHISGFFFIPIVFLLFITYKPKIPSKYYYYAIGLFTLIAVIPYLIQEKKTNYFTLNQMVKYIVDGREAGETLYQYLTNFNYAVIKNVSLNLFFIDNLFLDFLSIIILVTVIYYAVRFLSIRNSFLHFLAFLIMLYLLIFSLLVRFNETNIQPQWFQASFIPFLYIFLGGLIAKLKNTLFLFTIFMLLIGTYYNIRAIITYIPNYDKLAYQKNLYKLVSGDAKGQIFDTFPNNPRLKYLSYYIETDLVLKEHHLMRIKWANFEKPADLAYYFYYKNYSDDSLIAEKNKLGFTKVSQIFDDSELSVYKFSR